MTEAATAPKPRKNSRAKGAGFERTIAKDLRAWLGDEWSVMRTQTDRQRGQTGHGGEFTIERLADKAKFPFAIECKANEAFDYGHLWNAPIPGPFPKFWKQAARQAQGVDGRPMLILKRNLGEILVVLRLNDAVDGRGRRAAPSPRMLIDVDGDHLIAYAWRDFLVEYDGPIFASRP